MPYTFRHKCNNCEAKKIGLCKEGRDAFKASHSSIMWEEMCDIECPVDFFCTLPKGHKGYHEAGKLVRDGDRNRVVIARWYDKDKYSKKSAREKEKPKLMVIRF